VMSRSRCYRLYPRQSVDIANRMPDPANDTRPVCRTMNPVDLTVFIEDQA